MLVWLPSGAAQIGAARDANDCEADPAPYSRTARSAPGSSNTTESRKSGGYAINGLPAGAGEPLPALPFRPLMRTGATFDDAP